MNHIEIIITSVLIGKEFKDSFHVVKNSFTSLFQTFELSAATQFLKDNGLYNDYLKTCES